MAKKTVVETPVEEVVDTPVEEVVDSSFSTESRMVDPEVQNIGTTYEITVGGSTHLRQDN